MSISIYAGQCDGCFYHGVMALEVKGTKRKSEASKSNTHGCQREARFESMQNGDPHGKKRYRNLMPASDAVLHIS